MPSEAHVESYYTATAHALPDFPELSGEVTADVCVVGGGYAGLSTALELAGRGFDVVLLEANRVGWGASGRNGGQICTGYASGMEKIAGWLGADDARKLFSLAEEAKEIIRERVARHGIDCDLTWGYFHGAAKPRQQRELAETQEHWATAFGYGGTRLVEGRDEVARYVATAAYVGGLYDPGAGHLHPLNYCLGLARAASGAGVKIFEGSAVTALDTGARPRARTDRGAVKARFLVLCGNAYLGNLAPALRRKIMPVGTYIGATRPLGEDRARALIPGDSAVSDCNFVLNYYRLSADRRMLFGGRVSYSTLMPPNLPRAMRAKMLEVFPALADVDFDYTWGGFVAITVERTPHIGRLGDRVYFAQGFSGQGVAMTGIAGRVLAEAIAGQAGRFDVLARLPHKTFPGGRLFRTPTLSLAMLWYRMQDML
jgi:gamma-glutamylputrescine oxidase